MKNIDQYPTAESDAFALAPIPKDWLKFARDLERRNAALREALTQARDRFDLLSEYGLEDEAPRICVLAMKMIAKEETEQAAAILAATEARP